MPDELNRWNSNKNRTMPLLKPLGLFLQIASLCLSNVSQYLTALSDYYISSPRSIPFVSQTAAAINCITDCWTLDLWLLIHPTIITHNHVPQSPYLLPYIILKYWKEMSIHYSSVYFFRSQQDDTLWYPNFL